MLTGQATTRAARVTCGAATLMAARASVMLAAAHWKGHVRQAF
jgi:hypothetical protein